MALTSLRVWILNPTRKLPFAVLDNCQRPLSLVRLQSSKPKFQTSFEKDKMGRILKSVTKYDDGESKKEPHTVRYKQPKMKFVLQGVDAEKYTHVAIPYPKTGGRGWDGRVFNKRMGGGSRQKYRMIDFTRNAVSETEPLVEKVVAVRYDPLRSADIALVASGNHKRWIIAGEHMKAGNIIKSFGEIPTLPVAGKVGDAHPLGALAVGTVVHNIELFEKEGGTVARAAGTCGSIVRKLDDTVIVKMPSKREICISKKCVGTVGQVSNVDHSKQHIGSAARNRWFGVRPKSGLFKKKTGYHGRKIRPPKPMITYEKTTKKSLHEMFET